MLFGCMFIHFYIGGGLCKKNLSDSMKFNSAANSLELKPWYRRLYDFYIKISAWFLTIRLISVPLFGLVYVSGKFSLVGYGVEDTNTALILAISLILLSFLKEILDIIIGPKLTDRFWVPIYTIRFIAGFAIGTFLLFIPKIIFCYYHCLDYVTLGLGFVLVICWTKEDFYRRIVDQLALQGFDPTAVPPAARRTIVENSHSMSELNHNLNNYLTRKLTPFEPHSKFSLFEFVLDHPVFCTTMTAAAMAALGATLAGLSYLLDRHENAKKGSVIYYVQAHEDIKTDTVLKALGVVPFHDKPEERNRLDMLEQVHFSGKETRFLLNSLFSPGDTRYQYLDYERLTQFPSSGVTRVYYTPCSEKVSCQVNPIYTDLLRFSEGSRTSLSKEPLPTDLFYYGNLFYNVNPKDMSGSMTLCYAYIESNDILKFVFSTDSQLGSYSGFFAPCYRFYGSVDNFSPEQLTFLFNYFPRDEASTFKKFSEIPECLQRRFTDEIPSEFVSRSFSETGPVKLPTGVATRFSIDFFNSSADKVVDCGPPISDVIGDTKLNPRFVRFFANPASTSSNSLSGNPVDFSADGPINIPKEFFKDCGSCF